MKIDMWLFNRIQEITKQEYEAGKTDDEEQAIVFKDVENMLYDLVEEYDVLEEKYKDLQESIKNPEEPDAYDKWRDRL